MEIRGIASKVVVAAALVIGGSQAVVKTQGGSPLSNREHPRLWVTKASLPSVRAKMASGGGLNNDARTWQAWLDSNFSTEWSGNQRPYTVGHYAFAYLLLKDGPISGLGFSRSAAEYGARAKEIMLTHITSGDGGQMGSELEESVIVAYDWIQPILSSADRTVVTNWLQSAERLSDDGNSFNAALVGNRMNRVLSGLALLGDGVDDSWAQRQIDSYSGLFRATTGVTRSESDLSGADGGAGQGISYLWDYSMRRLLAAEEGYRTANGISLAAHYGGDDTRVFKYQPQNFAYHILPGGPSDSRYPGGRQYQLEKSQYMRAGEFANGDIEYTFWLTALAGLYRDVDPNTSYLAQWLITNRTGTMGNDGITILRDWVFGKFIVGPATPPPMMGPADLRLPTSRRFAEGKFVFQNDWNNPEASYVTMHLNEWHRTSYGMSPLMPGAFQIFRNGPQVINQGGAAGHDWGGSGRAGSANMLIFPDRSTSTPTGMWDDMGGHRLVSTPFRGSVNFVQNSSFDTLDEVRSMLADAPAGRDVNYVYADVTRSYNSTRFKDDYNPARVSEVVRELVYFPPDRPGDDSDRIVVLDRATTTNTKFEKEWLFHTAGEPMVDGPSATGPVRGGHSQGHSTYAAATRIVATNTAGGSNGRVFLTPLLPASRVVVKIGGSNASGGSWADDSHEFESPYGQIFSSDRTGGSIPAERAQFIGRYRIEIIPSVPSLSDVFLNVIEANDAGTSSASPTRALAGTLIAARVGNRIAAFAPNSSRVTTGKFTIADAGTYRIHMADLTSNGIYDVITGTSTVRATASAAGTLYLERSVAAGTVLEVRLAGAGAAAVAPLPATSVALLP